MLHLVGVVPVENWCMTTEALGEMFEATCARTAIGASRNFKMGPSVAVFSRVKQIFAVQFR